VEIGEPRATATRQPDEKARHDPRVVISRQPVREIQDKARQEACLGQTKQKAQHGEAGRSGHKSGCSGQQAPGDHDPSDPKARADLLHDNVAGDLEDEIAPEEDPRGEAELGGTHVQVTAHRKGGKSDVDAVDVGQQVSQDRNRQQAPIDFPDRRPLDRCVHDIDRCIHDVSPVCQKPPGFPPERFCLGG